MDSLKKDKVYKRLLKKMLCVELLGEKLYKTLAAKTKDADLKKIYLRLSANEHQTAEHIGKELLLLNQDADAPVGKKIKAMQFLIGLCPARLLSYVLKAVLRRKFYSVWFRSNKDGHEAFWGVLVRHENLQRELLAHYWKKMD